RNALGGDYNIDPHAVAFDMHPADTVPGQCVLCIQTQPACYGGLYEIMRKLHLHSHDGRIDLLSRMKLGIDEVILVALTAWSHGVCRCHRSSRRVKEPSR